MHPPSAPFVHAFLARLRPVYGALDKLTQPPGLVAFALLHGIAIVLVGLAHVVDVIGPLSPDRTKVVTGDYLAFLTGASIVAQGHGGALYDLSVQQQVQETLAGIKLDIWQPYLNPPMMAIALRPLANLPFTEGFRLFALTMIVAGIFGAWALVRALPAIARPRWNAMTIAALVLAFHPIATTMFGGQNTALTLALLCEALWALQQNRGWMAGAFVGLLSYKPQYLPLLGLLLVRERSWQALSVAITIGLIHYAVGALFVSPRWPFEMAATLAIIAPMELAQNAGTHFSLLPFFQYAVGGLAGKILAGFAIVFLAVGCAWAALRIRSRDPEFPLLWSAALVASMLMSPHLQYYEFGILVLPVCVAIETMVRRGKPPGFWLRLTIAIAYVGYPLFYKSSAAIGFQPLTLWTIALFGWLCWLCLDRRGQIPSPTPPPSSN